MSSAESWRLWVTGKSSPVSQNVLHELLNAEARLVQGERPLLRALGTVLVALVTAGALPYMSSTLHL